MMQQEVRAGHGWKRRMGKAAGGMEEQLGGWKSTCKDGKAAQGGGREAIKMEK